MLFKKDFLVFLLTMVSFLLISSCNDVKNAPSDSASKPIATPVVPKKVATAYVLRDGHKIDIPLENNDWENSELLKDGDTLYVSEGYLPGSIDISLRSPKKIHIVGAGIDKTSFRGSVFLSKDCGVTFSNMTIYSTDFRSWHESAFVHFYASKIVSRQLYTSAFYSRGMNYLPSAGFELTPSIMMVFSEVQTELPEGYLAQAYFSATRDHKTGQLVPLFSDNFGMYVNLSALKET